MWNVNQCHYQLVVWNRATAKLCCHVYLPASVLHCITQSHKWSHLSELPQEMLSNIWINQPVPLLLAESQKAIQTWNCSVNWMTVRTAEYLMLLYEQVGFPVVLNSFHCNICHECAPHLWWAIVYVSAGQFKSVTHLDECLIQATFIRS